MRRDENAGQDMTASANALLHALEAMDKEPELLPIAERIEALLPASRLAECAPMLQRKLPQMADLRRALVGLQRFLEQANEATDCAPVAEILTPTSLDILLTLCSQSPYLGAILSRRPACLPPLAAPAYRESAWTVAQYLHGLDDAVANEAPFAECCCVMRRFQQQALLRIGTRALVDHAPLQSVTEDLANLADAMLEKAYQAARYTLQQRYGLPLVEEAIGGEESAFVVIALGKLGGQELNFSSDIDLLFLYDEEGLSSGPESIDNVTWYRKLGEQIIQCLSENTSEGHIFRVDMRLRPHGSMGPLAVSMPSAVAYYADFGRAWERQALIKARPCAGNLALGRSFLQHIRPFVFPRYFDDAMLQDIRETKQQTEAMIARRGETEREVKQGRGGIRDIEFTVQMLQLLHGGHRPELRSANTLKAIAALGRNDLLRPLEATALADHYIFLRLVEHQLQLEHGRQCHALPADARALDAFARAFGYQSGAAFMNVYRGHTAETRKILERFLAAEGDGYQWVRDLLQRHSDGVVGMEKLAAMGFRDAGKARTELQHLANGDADNPYPIHIRQRFAEVAPTLLDCLTQAAEPDTLLLQLADLLNSMKAPATLYDLLRYNKNLVLYLVTLVANSRYLAQILTRDPALLEVVGSTGALESHPDRADLESALASLRRAYDADAALYRLRDTEMLRTAMQELVLDCSVAQVGDALSLLSEVILEDALAQACERVTRRHGAVSAPLAVLALGKLGGLEMGYGSDLDLVFVYDGSQRLENDMAPVEYFSAVAAQCIRILKEPTRYGRLYDIDLRLRPDGGKGMLAISRERLVDYFQEAAQPWERMALMKVRAVAGDAGFRKVAENTARDIAFVGLPDRNALESLERIRSKLVAQAKDYDLKGADGGIGAIEFAVRYRQLQHVSAHPALRRGDVFGALDYMLAHRCIEQDEGQILRNAYEVLRRILNRIRMYDGNDRSTLPEHLEAREALARRLGLQEDPLQIAEAHRNAVRAIYKNILQDMLSQT